MLLTRPFRFVQKLTVLICLVLFGSSVQRTFAAPTVFVPGDIAFLRINLDAPDSFSFVTLVNIAEGDQIHFITFDWGGTSFNNFTRNEAMITWSAPVGGITAGTVVSIEESQITANTFITNVGSTAIVTGVSTGTDKWDLRSAGGDSILAFTGTVGSPSFIAGILSEDNWNVDVWDPSTDWSLPNPPYAGSLASCNLPSNLTNGTNAISVFPPSIPAATNGPGIEKDNARYKAGVLSTGTRSQLLAAINNHVNWEVNDDTSYSAPAVTSFTVLPDVTADAPTVTTPTSASVAQDSATLGGNVTADGGASITERGVVYALTATNANPEIGGTGVTKVAGTGTTGVFTVSATSLVANSAYSFKAYATNSEDTSYSPVGTFSTLADMTAPTVVSVVRSAPSAQAISTSSVTFRVTYSEPVTGVAVGRFVVMPVGGSDIVGTVTGVTPVSTSVYDVAVTITSGTGEFRLRVQD